MHFTAGLETMHHDIRFMKTTQETARATQTYHLLLSLLTLLTLLLIYHPTLPPPIYAQALMTVSELRQRGDQLDYMLAAVPPATFYSHAVFVPSSSSDSFIETNGV